MRQLAGAVGMGAGAQAERIRLNRITMTKNLDRDFKDVSNVMLIYSSFFLLTCTKFRKLFNDFLAIYL